MAALKSNSFHLKQGVWSKSVPREKNSKLHLICFKSQVFHFPNRSKSKKFRSDSPKTMFIGRGLQDSLLTQSIMLSLLLFYWFSWFDFDCVIRYMSACAQVRLSACNMKNIQCFRIFNIQWLLINCIWFLLVWFLNS